MQPLEFDDLVLLFDQGEIFQSEEYNAVTQKELELYRLLSATFGNSVTPLLDAYTEVLEEKTDLEIQHYFQQGILMGRRADLAERTSCSHSPQ